MLDREVIKRHFVCTNATDIESNIEYNGMTQGATMTEKYEPLEKYLRGLPTSQEVVTLTGQPSTLRTEARVKVKVHPEASGVPLA